MQISKARLGTGKQLFPRGMKSGRINNKKECFLKAIEKNLSQEECKLNSVSQLVGNIPSKWIKILFVNFWHE